MKHLRLLLPAFVLPLSFAILCYGEEPNIVVTSETSQATDSLTNALVDSLEQMTQLDDVVITATKKLVTSDGATLTYDVSEDPEAQGSSTLEILKKVPGVTVDAEDNIKVNGQSSFKIFLNGREDPMMKGDVKTILKAMPASSIKKIEVISEPGAKYEAEGTGGILNIVTETKQSLEGYLLNLNYFMNQSTLGGGLYGRTKIGKVTADANIYVNNSYSDKFSGQESYQEYENLQSFENHLSTTHTSSSYKQFYLGGKVNLSWEPDTLNLYTISFNGSKWKSTTSPLQSLRMYDADGGLTYSLDRRYTGEYSGPSISAQASYQHTFKKEGHNLVLTYSYTHGGSHQNSLVESYNIYNYPEMDYIWSSNVNDQTSNSHIFQVDYANPFSPKHLLEVGMKGNLNRTDVSSAPYYGMTREGLEMDESAHVDFDQFNDILAAYGSYTGKYDKWNVRAGLRYEHTRRGIKYHIVPDGYSDFTNYLNDWVPNASVSYRFGSSQNIRAAYQLRISRPGIYALNPYRNTLTPGQVSYGNPDLESEKSHNISLTYSNYEGKLNGSFKINYFYTDNAVSDIIFAKDGLVNTTYANQGTSNEINMQVNLNWSPINNLNFGLWLYEEWSHQEVNSELFSAKRVYWRTTFNFNVDYTAPFKLRTSFYSGYGSPWKDLQSEGTSWYYYGLGFSRSFLKNDALTISLSGQNFIPAKRTSNWSQISDTARIFSSSKYNQWHISFGVSWRLGSLKSDVKKTNANIEEMQTTSSGNKGN